MLSRSSEHSFHYQVIEPELNGGRLFGDFEHSLRPALDQFDRTGSEGGEEPGHSTCAGVMEQAHLLGGIHS